MRNLSDTEVLRQSRVSLGWVLSDDFRVGQLTCQRPPKITNLRSFYGTRLLVQKSLGNNKV